MAQAWRSQLRAADGACSPLHRVACSRPPLGHPDASRVLQPPALTQPCSTHRPPSSIQAASEASDAPQQPATAATRDAPDRSQRTAARLQRQQAREARKGVLVPVAMPQGQGDPRERGQALEGAAVAQMLAGVTDPEERQALLASLDARAQQQLVQEFESLSPLDQQVILSAINSPYNDMSFWEEQLMEPLMQDILREDLGPELAAIMDVLFGVNTPPKPTADSSSQLLSTQPDPQTDSNAQKGGRRRLRARASEPPSEPKSGLPVMWSEDAWRTPGEARRRLAKLTREQRERVPELFAFLNAQESLAQEVGEVVQGYEAKEAAAAHRRHLRLARRAREQGLRVPDPPQAAVEYGLLPPHTPQPDMVSALQQEYELLNAQLPLAPSAEGDAEAAAAAVLAAGGEAGPAATPSVLDDANNSVQHPTNYSDTSTGARGANSSSNDGTSNNRDSDGVASASSQTGAGGSVLTTRFSQMRDVLEERGLIAPSVSRSVQDHAASAQGQFLDTLAHEVHTSQQATSASTQQQQQGQEGEETLGDSGDSGDNDSFLPDLDDAVGRLREEALKRGLDPSTASLVERLGAVYKRYNVESGTGWEEEGHLGSPAMQMLKRAALCLSQAARVSDMDSLLASGVWSSPEEYSIQLQQALGDIEELLRLDRERGELSLPDPAVRATLLYIRTQLLRPVPQDMMQGDGEESEDNTAAQQDGVSSAEDVLYLPNDIETTDRLLQFIAAAEAWEALHGVTEAWGARRPGAAATPLIQSMTSQGQRDILWWAIRPDHESFADTAAAAGDTTHTQDTASDTGAGAGARSMSLFSQPLKSDAKGNARGSRDLAAIRFNMRRRLERLLQDQGVAQTTEDWSDGGLVADEDKIQALATLDAGVLRCVQEMDEHLYSDEIVMKWSLHPVVGPRLSAGLPLIDTDTVHPFFRDLFASADMMPVEGIDFDFALRPRSEPLSQAYEAMSSLLTDERLRADPEALLQALQEMQAQTQTQTQAQTQAQTQGQTGKGGGSVSGEQEGGEADAQGLVMQEALARAAMRVGVPGRGARRNAGMKEAARRRAAARRRVSQK